MSRIHPQQVLRGYFIGVSVAILGVAASMPGLSLVVLLLGPFFACLLGLVIVLPAVIVLSRIGQARPWWAMILGVIVMMVSARQWLSPGSRDHIYLFMMTDFAGRQVPDWPLVGYALLGAFSGLAGWVAAFGFRLRPLPPEEHPKASDGSDS